MRPLIPSLTYPTSIFRRKLQEISQNPFSSTTFNIVVLRTLNLFTAIASSALPTYIMRQLAGIVLLVYTFHVGLCSAIPARAIENSGRCSLPPLSI